MKSISVIATFILLSSNLLIANEIESAPHVTLTSETLNLSDLLSRVQSCTQQLLETNDESYQSDYYEFKENLLLTYAVYSLYPEETGTIEHALDESYTTLQSAIDSTKYNSLFQRSLELLTSSHPYEHETIVAQPLHGWVNSTVTDDLKSVIHETDADIVYIGDNVIQNGMLEFPHSPSHLLYRAGYAENSKPRILIVKRDKHDKHDKDSSEYKTEGGVRWHLGGKDHGKFEAYVEGEVKDKNGNYAKGKVSKDEDGEYDCDVKGGKEKKRK